ncbi:MAG TPA: DUF3300 domain-containing protein [Thermodesulfobacteriota bacterium]|nr:DUF3300 domain-containing protein [Thermodesulfobacteriota bacterium]
MEKETFLRIILVMFLCVNLAVPSGLMAQEAKQGSEEKLSFRPEEIDQMVAPIALYPDSLLAQVLTASTYPLEIVQAGRFVQQNKDLKGEKLMQAAKDKDWEPSVKAMLSFPDVLLMMNEKLEWTEKLGNAFLGQQREVMASVQRLRQKAQESGNLKTTKEQKVVVQQETKVIVIESASPQVVYVPTYNPVVVYGAWPYPAYPPAPVYPPGYVATAGLAFAAGVAVGAAHSGYGGWGCGWGNNEININASTQNNFTKNNYNNPQKYQAKQNQNWQHNPEHRKGAQYPNQATAQKYGQQGSGGGARPSSSEARGYGGGGGERGSASAQTSNASRGGGKESALSGSGKGGSERASSNRGNESLGSASRSGGASASSRGASRSSGGASRGGGGRGGGGRR